MFVKVNFAFLLTLMKSSLRYSNLFIFKKISFSEGVHLPVLSNA